LAPCDRGPDEVAVGVHERRPRPPTLSRVPWSGPATDKADEAPGDEWARTRRAPGRGATARELAL
jgi:hypothetical protein